MDTTEDGRGPVGQHRADGTPASLDESLGPIVKFSGLTKRFADGTVALSDLDLSIRPGEFVSLVGPSGCGKSTLLRIAAGLSPISEGRVETRFDSLGYIFQDATLMPWRTVAHNVELLAQLEGLPKARRRLLAQEAIDLVGLSGFEGNFPKTLSGGMRMRVSLARSLTLNPNPFMFDEPFGALDAITRERLNDEVLKLYTQRRFTAVFVTHSIAEAVYLSSRVVVMAPRPGRVIGEFDVPFDYPRSPHLRYSEEFGAIAHEVSECLRGASA
ncbi:ABC transporter ATP-binding protein [Streptomyces sp. NBC_01716]|uniref:ABC transporter ATP-binding protein n=1 Tax=Streptomyces sp. NBC_01716 TaxID=2975917 RepID=UPI002E332278|nr:ABC transporter ATP-binding protein [Streptomyces sp. NBC_01716]